MVKSYSPSYYFLTNRHIPRRGRISWLEPSFLSEAQSTTPVGPSRNKHLHSQVPSDQDVQPYAMFSMSKPVSVDDDLEISTCFESTFSGCTKIISFYDSDSTYNLAYRVKTFLLKKIKPPKVLFPSLNLDMEHFHHHWPVWAAERMRWTYKSISKSTIPHPYGCFQK